MPPKPQSAAPKANASPAPKPGPKSAPASKGKSSNSSSSRYNASSPGPQSSPGPAGKLSSLPARKPFKDEYVPGKDVALMDIWRQCKNPGPNGATFYINTSKDNLTSWDKPDIWEKFIAECYPEFECVIHDQMAGNPNSIYWKEKKTRNFFWNRDPIEIRKRLELPIGTDGAFRSKCELTRLIKYACYDDA